MDSHDNHYEYLGIPIAASRHEVHAAVEDLIRQANALSYTSPDRARQLWTRIRRIRADLLTHPKRREAYDAELLRSLETPALALAALPIVAEAVASPPPVAASARTSAAAAAVATPPSAARPQWLVSALLSGALVTILVAAMIISSLKAHTQPTHTALKPPPVALTVRGSTRAGAYLPDRPIQLRWTRNLNAKRYRVQLAAADGVLSANTFKHPILNAVTGGTSYRLHIPGGRLYAWRLQAYIHGHWQAYGPARFFYVARPAQHPIAGGAGQHPRSHHSSRRSKQPPEMAAVITGHRRSGHTSSVRPAVRRASRSGSPALVAVASHPAVAYAPSRRTSGTSTHPRSGSYSKAPGRSGGSTKSTGHPTTPPHHPANPKPVSGKPGSGKPPSRPPSGPPAQMPPSTSPVKPPSQPAPTPPTIVPVVAAAPAVGTKGNVVSPATHPTQSVPVVGSSSAPPTTTSSHPVASTAPNPRPTNPPTAAPTSSGGGGSTGASHGDRDKDGDGDDDSAEGNSGGSGHHGRK